MTDAYKTCVAILNLALIQFWRQSLPENESILTLLNQQAHSVDIAQPVELTALKKTYKDCWPPLGDRAFESFIRQHKLSFSDAILLCLLCEMENNHIICMTVHELQSPTLVNRPQVHLVQAILEMLFPNQVFPPIYFQNHLLTEHKCIHLEGNAPLPIQTLRVDSHLATAFLSNRKAVSSIENKSRTTLAKTTLAQIPALVTLLKNHTAQHLIIRGQVHSGRHTLASLIAEKLNKTPYFLTHAEYEQNPQQVSVCDLTNQLPIVELILKPGENKRINLPRHSSTMIFVLTQDGTLNLDNTYECFLSLPTAQERKALWLKHLGNSELSESAACQAILSGPVIKQLAQHAMQLAETERAPIALKHITQARQTWGREQLKMLAQPDTRAIVRDAIVLPPLVDTELQRLLHRTLHRETLWDQLGITLKNTQTPGVRALFIGESGTGKTLAASYIATQLCAPLYRVDLSAVMNKYIGESEKNLSKVLDMAAANDVVLLFDEADSLFGKRSEGKDTGERFANMLTHFLLTRLENHPGIVILTTNNRERIDKAFSRRLDFIIEFPTPNFNERINLWQSHLGAHSLNNSAFQILASHCDFTGGQLRNVVLTAASHAQQSTINVHHLLVGLEAEYRKLGREIPHKLRMLTEAVSTEEESPQ
jgi:hypothetical protein